MMNTMFKKKADRERREQQQNEQEMTANDYDNNGATTNEAL